MEDITSKRFLDFCADAPGRIGFAQLALVLDRA
jgi:hypothetical protein